MKAVFFDLDGTLFDTRADIAATVNHTRRDLGLPELSDADVFAHVGQGARHLLLNAIPESPRPYDELWEIFRSHYLEHATETVRPYPGVRETLDELRARGWRLALNTNKPNFSVRPILEKLGFADCFGDAIVAGGDGCRLKPDPQSLHVCAQRLGQPLTPDDWMVGDNWTDLDCAANAGIRSAFCAYGFGSRRESPCTVRLECFADLLRHLNP